MKVKEARELLKGYSDEELYQKGRIIFREEIDNIITLRSHGNKPTRGVIESAINQAKEWFIKVAEGFPWSEFGSIKNIIQWETSDTWIKYKMLDPVVENWRKRARLEMFKGSPLPLLTSLTEEALDAVSGVFASRLKAGATLYSKREEFAKKIGKRVCPFGEKERFCINQAAYSMTGVIPISIEDCVFICNVDKCYKE